MRSSTKCLRTTLKRSCCACERKFFGFRTAQPFNELLARHRRVVQQRHQQRPHFLTIGVPKRTKSLGILPGKTRKRGACPFEVLVDDDSRAVAKDRRLLHGWFDVGKSVTMQLEVVQQR